MKAWKVEGYEDHSVIVFAETRGKATALGASEMDAAFRECTTRRAPSFDGITDGHELIRAQLRAAWWFGCNGPKCDREVRDEVSYEADDSIMLNPYVIRAGSVYCSSACCLEQLRKVRRERVALWDAVRRAVERWPGVEVFSAYENMAGDWILHIRRPENEHVTVELLEADRSAA